MQLMLKDYFEDAAGLDADAFAKKHAALFLTCADPDSLSPQVRPQATAQLSADMLRAVLDDTDQDTSMLAIPVRRAEDSAYRFISVGRTSNCDVTVNDASVSKLHAIIREAEDGRFTIEDAGSANGTFVDDEAAPKRGEGEPMLLRDGTAVCFGRANFEVWSAARVWERARKLATENGGSQMADATKDAAADEEG